MSSTTLSSATNWMTSECDSEIVVQEYLEIFYFSVPRFGSVVILLAARDLKVINESDSYKKHLGAKRKNPRTELPAVHNPWQI